MTGVELLIDLIQTKNQATLDDAGITLSTSNIRFTDLYPGEYDDGMNTKVGAIAFGFDVEGTHVYYYKRPDIQEAFAEIGVDQPMIEMSGAINLATVLAALDTKYNLKLEINDVDAYQYVDDVVTIRIKARSYVWLGTLTVDVTVGALTLGQAFPNNVLNGFNAPTFDLADVAPITDLNGFEPA